MKNTLKNSLILCGLLLAASMSFGQTLLTTTTLNSAVASSSTTSIQLASSTGVTAGATVLFIADSGNSGEAVFVNSVASSGGYVGVTRGYQTLGGGAPHASGAVVFIGPPFAFATIQPKGSCTRSTAVNGYLPVIALGSQSTGTTISDCVGGVWVTGSTASINTFNRLPLPSCGGTVYTSCGTSTAIAAATSMYCSELDVPYSKYVTGLGVMNGVTATTDKHLLILYDGTGNLLANSAVAGVLEAGASNYQTYAFTAPYYVVGPAKYYGCLQSNGTTGTVNMLATQIGDTYLTKAVTGQTFGTIASSFTVPTTFTTVVGPLFEMY